MTTSENHNFEKGCTFNWVDNQVLFQRQGQPDVCSTCTAFTARRLVQRRGVGVVAVDGVRELARFGGVARDCDDLAVMAQAQRNQVQVESKILFI